MRVEQVGNITAIAFDNLIDVRTGKAVSIVVSPEQARICVEAAAPIGEAGRLAAKNIRRLFRLHRRKLSLV